MWLIGREAHFVLRVVARDARRMELGDSLRSSHGAWGPPIRVPNLQPMNWARALVVNWRQIRQRCWGQAWRIGGCRAILVKPANKLGASVKPR